MKDRNERNQKDNPVYVLIGSVVFIVFVVLFCVIVWNITHRKDKEIVINSSSVVTTDESSSEEVLQKVLDCYDGNENHRVSGTYDIFPEYLRQSLTLEFEILRMCGIVATSPRLLGENWQLYLTPQGKNYFDNKEKVIASKSMDTRLEIPVRKKYDVFISHANKDKLDYVDELYLTLRRLGINIFYDSEVLSWGDNWKQVILDGTAQSEFAIIVISNQFFGH